MYGQRKPGFVLSKIMRRKIRGSFFKKCLTDRWSYFIQERSRVDGPKLRDGEIQMLTTWTNIEQTAKRRPTAAMRGVCLGLGSAPVNYFDGRLGSVASIDSRHLRH